MNKNLKRHKLLGILSEKYLSAKFKEPISNIEIEYSVLIDKLQISEKTLLKICHLPDTNKEIIISDGLFYITQQGIDAFIDKKYIRMFWLNIWNYAKNWITIMSLIVAAMALYIMISTKDKQDEEQLKKVQDRLYKLEQMQPNSKN